MRTLIAIPLAVIGALWFYFLILPWPVLRRWRDPGHTSFMELRIREARDESRDFEIRQTWVPLDRISRNLQRAVIVAEDGNFREHDGVDWAALGEELHYRGDGDFSLLDPGDLRSLANAFAYYRGHREKIRGRSTITQQLAKNLYFSSRRSPLRKLNEYIVTRRLECFLSKDRILELYLNVAEWGPGIFGAEAASQAYFDRSAAKLTRVQAATLAATLPHPLTSNPDLHAGRMAWRRDMILARMTGTGPARTVPADPADERDTVSDRRAAAARTDTVPVDTGIAGLPDSIAADSIVQDSAVAKRDTVRDSARAIPDTARDTVPPDTFPPDTLRRAPVSARR